MRASGASRCSRSSSPSARSCRGPSRRPARSRPSRTPIPATGRTGCGLLRQGLSAEEVVRRLTEADDGRAERQVGVVDAQGRAATYTGSGCHDWAGGRTGEGYAAQGNILVSEATVDALAETFEAATGTLAQRLLESLAAGQAAGGDSRGQQSAALLVVERDGGLRRPFRRPRRPARRRPRAADRGAAPAARPPRPAVRQVGRRRADRHRRGAQARARRAPRAPRLRAARGLGGVENLEERIAGEGRIYRSPWTSEEES